MYINYSLKVNLHTVFHNAVVTLTNYLFQNNLIYDSFSSIVLRIVVISDSLPTRVQIENAPLKLAFNSGNVTSYLRLHRKRYWRHYFFSDNILNYQKKKKKCFLFIYICVYFPTIFRLIPVTLNVVFGTNSIYFRYDFVNEIVSHLFVYHQSSPEFHNMFILKVLNPGYA